MTDGMVLNVPNLQCEDSGKPPQLVAGKGYTSYFENDYGEQMVFQYDRKEHRGLLYHGDCGWENTQEVYDGFVVGLMLSDEEQEWLQLVWSVATGHEPETVMIEFSIKAQQAKVKFCNDIINRFPEIARDFRMEKLTAQNKIKRLKKSLDLAKSSQK